jgi:hypothetical protein
MKFEEIQQLYARRVAQTEGEVNALSYPLSSEEDKEIEAAFLAYADIRAALINTNNQARPTPTSAAAIIQRLLDERVDGARRKQRKQEIYREALAMLAELE